MKKHFILILFFLMNGCVSSRVIVTNKAKIQVKTLAKQKEVKPKLYGFGPWMMPIFGAQNSLRITYVTAYPEPTDLYFSMAGDIDWTRGDSEKVRVHSMDFEDLEYSAEYQFRLETHDSGVSKVLSVKTQPWGGIYSFSFAIVDSENLSFLSNKTDFVILTGFTGDREQEIAEFYTKHSNIMKHTPVIPTRSLFLQEQNIGFVRNGVGYWDYRDFRIVILNKNADDFENLRFLFSKANTGRIILICDGADTHLVEGLYASYGDRVKYLITTSDLNLKEQILIDGMGVFEVKKKSGRRMAMTFGW